MRGDPDEGVRADGTIRTGVARDRVPATFEPVLADAVAALPDGASLYLYGSVATGRAVVPDSDVDLLTLGVQRSTAAELSAVLSLLHRDRCRGVEVAPADRRDLDDDGDAAHGLRVFLRHHCVHIAGPDPVADLPPQRADRAAARGLNGDLAVHVRRWEEAVAAGADPRRLGRQVARRTLVAMAGIASVREGTWTTDREAGARHWQASGATGSDVLLGWVDEGPSSLPAVRAAVHGVVRDVLATFSDEVGLWSEPPPSAAAPEAATDPLPLLERDVVRVVARDARGAVLLLHTRSQDHPAMGTWWELPGGGLEAGETVAEAAVRELREETGLVVAPADVPPPTWRRTGSFPEGAYRHVQHEVVVAVDVDGRRPAIDMSGQESRERATHGGHRWWTPQDMATSTEAFYPRSLPDHLRAVVAGEPVDEPLEWWP